MIRWEENNIVVARIRRGKRCVASKGRENTVASLATGKGQNRIRSKEGYR
jgi:hypothetical protein